MSESNMIACDQFMYFSYNGIHSSQYNLFIINEGELTLENNIGASSEFISALSQEGVYYTGTKRTQKTFKRKCAAEGLTLGQYKEMMKWLASGSTGFLTFDFNPYWGWNVVLEDVGDASFYPDHGKYIVEFELTWKTIGSYLARNFYGTSCDARNLSQVQGSGTISTCNGYYNDTMVGNEFGIPVVYYEQDDNESVKNNQYFIQSVNNMYQYVNFTYQFQVAASSTASTALTISHNDINYVDLATSGHKQNTTIQYLGESNRITSDRTLIELTNVLQHNYQSAGVLQLPSQTPMVLHSACVVNEGIQMDKAEFDQICTQGYNYICLTRQLSTETNSSDWNTGTYSAAYQTFFFYLNLTSESITATAALGNIPQTNESYAEYVASSKWGLTNVDGISSTTATGDEASTSKILLQTYLTNTILGQDIDWSQFTYYAGYSNILYITCTCNQSQNVSATIDVVSMNNL